MARVCLIFCFVLMQWSKFVFGNDSDNLTSVTVDETLIKATIPILQENRVNVTSVTVDESLIKATIPILQENRVNVTSVTVDESLIKATIPILQENRVNETTQLISNNSTYINETYLNETYLNGSDSILNDPLLKGFDPKSMLRYGFHRTYECQDFLLAYKCIARCLKQGYDIAISNRTCGCNCIKNKDKAKYHKIVTQYRYPTTTKPAWAVGSTPEASTLPGKLKVIDGEYVYYLSGEGSSAEKTTVRSHEHPSHEHGSDEHGSDENGSDEHGSDNHESEEHHSEEHHSEEHNSEEHHSEEHQSEEHQEEEHQEEEHEEEEAEEAERRADVGAENY